MMCPSYFITDCCEHVRPRSERGEETRESTAGRRAWLVESFAHTVQQSRRHVGCHSRWDFHRAFTTWSTYFDQSSFTTKIHRLQSADGGQSKCPEPSACTRDCLQQRLSAAITWIRKRKVRSMEEREISSWHYSTDACRLVWLKKCTIRCTRPSGMSYVKI